MWEKEDAAPLYVPSCLKFSKFPTASAHLFGILVLL